MKKIRIPKKPSELENIKPQGLPENYNPFLVVLHNDFENEPVDDDTLEKVALEYFRYDSGGDCPFARWDVATPLMNQEKAEALVRKIVNGDPKRAFAVKEECAHIIPDDLKKFVRVARMVVDMYRNEGVCNAWNCYYLEK